MQKFPPFTCIIPCICYDVHRRWWSSVISLPVIEILRRWGQTPRDYRADLFLPWIYRGANRSDGKFYAWVPTDAAYSRFNLTPPHAPLTRTERQRVLNVQQDPKFPPLPFSDISFAVISAKSNGTDLAGRWDLRVVSWAESAAHIRILW